MANVEWAKSFFDRVTATLPDLLTKHGEGKELEAFEELGSTLRKERDEANAKRRAELTTELAGLGGPAPTAPSDPSPSASAGTGGDHPSEAAPVNKSKRGG